MDENVWDFVMSVSSVLCKLKQLNRFAPITYSTALFLRMSIIFILHTQLKISNSFLPIKVFCLKCILMMINYLKQVTTTKCWWIVCMCVINNVSNFCLFFIIIIILDIYKKESKCISFWNILFTLYDMLMLYLKLKVLHANCFKQR